jgi:glycosyltransferase involved in cell wall biosynthesis
VKKIAVIGTVGLPASYGGFETLVNYLVLYLSDKFEFTVFCEKRSNTKRIREFNGASLKYLPFKANGIQSIMYDIVSIIYSWFKYDTLLILGTPGCVVLPILKLIKNTTTIINFGGVEWKRKKWGKLARIYLKLTEIISINYASYIVADNKYFFEYIKNTYKRDSYLIEYGGDHVSKIEITSELLKKYSFLNLDYDLSISRAQPDNNLHIILEAYSRRPDKNVVLVSNYHKNQYGKNLLKQYEGFPNIYMQPAIYNLYELDALRSNARLYIHSHMYCGTAPSLVEAMSHGLPVVAFEVKTNRYTTDGKAQYFTTADELKKILEKIETEDILSNAREMSRIAKKRYTWKLITDNYSKLFLL